MLQIASNFQSSHCILLYGFDSTPTKYDSIMSTNRRSAKNICEQRVDLINSCVLLPANPINLRLAVYKENVNYYSAVFEAMLSIALRLVHMPLIWQCDPFTFISRMAPSYLNDMKVNTNKFYLQCNWRVYAPFLLFFQLKHLPHWCWCDIHRIHYVSRFKWWIKSNIYR